jgi:enamine deaminase RidA (YjgF/YER057c/UK114 family)
LTSQSNGRRTSGLIDGNGFYQSRAALGGSWVFAAAPAVTDTGEPAPEAAVEPPYHLSDSATVRTQSRYILERYREALTDLDCSFENITQVEQYITLKAHADGYLEVSRGPGFFERRRPGSCLMQTGTFLPQSNVIQAMPLGFTHASGFTKDITTSGLLYVKPKPERGPSHEQEGPFSEVVMAGPYVFCTLWASDYETGVHPDVKVEDWVWWGNEMRSEAKWAVGALDKKLEAGGTTSDQVVHCTAFLNDLGDLYELDQIWAEKFPVDPPARTVLPVRGQGAPRREGALTHAEGSVRMEIQVRALRPGHGAERSVISTGSETLGHQSEAVKAGDLLWISGTLAGDRGGLRAGSSAASQIDYLMGRIEAICAAGGTSLANLLRVRAYVTEPSDGYLLHAALRNAFPDSPPCVAVNEVRGPLLLPNASIMIDGVAWVPHSA